MLNRQVCQTAKWQRHISVSGVSVHYWPSLSKRYAKREETREKGNRKSIDSYVLYVFYRFLPGIFLLLSRHRASIYSLSVFHLLIFPFSVLLFLSLPPADRLECLSTIINNFRRIFFLFAWWEEFHDFWKKNRKKIK